MEQPLEAENTAEVSGVEQKLTRAPEVKRRTQLKVIEAPVEVEEPAEAPAEAPVAKRKGRPVGAKDSKPRVKKVIEEGPVEETPVDNKPDAVHSY